MLPLTSIWVTGPVVVLGGARRRSDSIIGAPVTAEADVQQRLKFRQEHGGGRRQGVWWQLGRFDLIGALGQGMGLADIDQPGPPRSAARTDSAPSRRPSRVWWELVAIRWRAMASGSSSSTR